VLELEWHRLPRHFIDNIVSEWRRRLQCDVDQNDTLKFEHMFH